MHKILPWSVVLSEADQILSLMSDQLTLQDITNNIANSIKGFIEENYYKSLSLNIVRSGLPCYNYYKQEEVKPPYYLVRPDYSPTPKFLKDAFQKAFNIRQKFITSEYLIWNRLKKEFHNNGCNFIEIKKFYEADIINYFKNRTQIEVIPSETPLTILTFSNPDYTKDNKGLKISNVYLDSIINNIN